jgi:SAM-dependent methyltransferase
MLDFVVVQAQLRPGDWVVDVGCGTGAIAIALAEWGAQAIGIDPSAERVNQAQAEASASGVADRTHWHVGTGDDVPMMVRHSVRLVTFGKSLHRMNRDRVLAYCDHVVVPTGSVAVLTSRFAEKPEWMAIGLPVLRKFQHEISHCLAPPPPVEDEDHAAALARSPFRAIVSWSDSLTLVRDIDDVIGVYLGSEGLGASVLGPRQDEFEAQLKCRLLESRPDGMFVEHYALEALCARRA